MAPPVTSLLLLVGAACGVAAAGAPGSSWDPRAPGPFNVSRAVHLKAHSGSQGPPFALVAFLPEAPGVYPVAAFVPGFLCDPAGYSSLLSRIASHGIAVVGLEIPPVRTLFEGATKRSEDVASCLDFMTSDGGAALSDAVEAAGGPSGVRLDTANGLMGLAHSIGGHALLLALEKISCFGIKLVAMFDPVDGVDPFGFEAQYLVPLGIHPEVHLNYTMPMALIMTGHGADKVGYAKYVGLPSCAPRDRSDLHWYESMQAPKWLVNMTDIGHNEVLDEGISSETKLAICPRGPGATTKEERATYRETVAGLVVSLAEAFLDVPKAPSLPVDQRLRWLEDPMMLAPLRATGVFDRGTGAIQAGCRHTSGTAKVVNVPKPALVV